MGQSNTLNIPGVERFFLDRLARFSHLAAEASASGIPQWSRLARHATLSAYKDCVSIGLEREASEILAKPRIQSTPTT